MTRSLFVAAMFGVALLAGCSGQSNTASALPFPPVPPPMQEAIPKPPVTGEQLLWQPGHWNWNGNGYVWQPGEYVPAAGHGNLFQTGYWEQTATGWRWVPAHWTS
ncbi:MAG TPA: YXWGXW repeat-containing protein [Acetobacteraceae bacterium]|jgi:WXXGXW repeat (2 copies)|nr:YXWGXW repeat-containing protein [Acetobacteraceae bacterium]